MAPLCFGAALVVLAAGTLQRPASSQGARPFETPSTALGGQEFGDFRVAVEFEDSGSIGAAGQLWLLPTSSMSAPDLLAYGTAQSGPMSALPPDAVLLGPLSVSEPSSVDFSAEVRSVVLFSLGHGNVIETVDLSSISQQEN